MEIGEIINVAADESVVADGAVDVEKFRPISYEPFSHSYYGLGKKVGNAFKDGMQLK